MLIGLIIVAVIVAGALVFYLDERHQHNLTKDFNADLQAEIEILKAKLSRGKKNPA